MSGRNPPSYCTLTLIAMQGHQQKGRQNNTSSNNKDKFNTIIETSTAEDHDNENLHNPSTRPRYSPGSRRREKEVVTAKLTELMSPRQTLKCAVHLLRAVCVRMSLSRSLWPQYNTMGVVTHELRLFFLWLCEFSTFHNPVN